MTVVNTTTWEAAIWQEPMKHFKENNRELIGYQQSQQAWFGRMAVVEMTAMFRKEMDAMYAYKQACEYLHNKMNALCNIFIEVTVNVYKNGKMYSLEADISFSGNETSNDYEFEAHMTGGSIIDRLELNGNSEQFAITMTSGAMTEYWIGGVDIG